LVLVNSRFNGVLSMVSQSSQFQIENVLSPSRIVRRPRIPCSQILVASALLAGITLAGLPAQAQVKTKVDVDVSKPKAMVYATSFGIAPDRWDNKAWDATTIPLLQDAGVTLLKFPGNGGTAGLFRWSTNTIINPYPDDKVADFPKERQFPAVAPVIDKLGTAMITIDYGSNMDGSGGGEPAEAAAWVAYLNGSADNTMEIGKDSKGNDWKTVGYWAGLRGADPLPTDDGKNSLRIGHSQPFGIQLWTIGNDPYNNGYYGQDHTLGADWKTTGLFGQSYPMEPDLHMGTVPTAKDWGKHVGNSKVGPVAYGQNVVQFVKAMKAVDPKIFIGAAVAVPPISSDPNAMGKKWNEGVLKAACGSMDFAAVSFSEGRGDPKDNEYLDVDSLLHSSKYNFNADLHYDRDDIQQDYALLSGDLIEKYKKYCPAGHFPPLVVDGLGMNSWLPTKDPGMKAAVALYAAEAIPMLLEEGAYSVVWGPIHGPSPTFLSEDDKPQPAFYAIKLLHTAAGPGDTFVTANSPLEFFDTYAFKRHDGGLALLFVNKILDRSVTATVSVPGYSYAKAGTRYDWGKAESDAGKGITEAPIDNLGGSFNVEVPRMGITVVVIPKAN
jgi:hypothetical protein